MADQKIHLRKEVISNLSALELYEGSFDEVIISEEIYDDEKLKTIYGDLFYQIPKFGKDSHETIITKSNEVIHPEIDQNLEGSIEIQSNTITELNNQFLSLTLPPEVLENPYFSNGMFIQEGIVELDYPIGNTLYYVQQGFKRKVNQDPHYGFLDLLRRCLKDPIYDTNNNKIPLSSSPYYRLATPNELNGIDEAEEIYTGQDLSIIRLTAKENQTDIYSELKIKF